MLHMHLQDLHYPSKPVAPNLYISKNKVYKQSVQINYKINLVIIILFFKYKIVSKFLH